MLHCTAMETTQVNPYSYRMHQLMNQVRILFGEDSKELNKFAKQSQISQAEAMKFFIERFRVKKPQRTGIIWWNLTDGWPSVSDAVTGYYFDKKLAYFYIKRTQNPLFMMIDEPDENGLCDLHAVNDLQISETFTYTVKDLYNDETVASGEASIDADGHIVLDKLALKSKHFYYIEWNCSNGKTYSNHYFTDIFTDMDKEDRAYINIDEYLAALEKCGYDEFVGFDN
jgi:beta-mannosidase